MVAQNRDALGAGWLAAQEYLKEAFPGRRRFGRFLCRRRTRGRERGTHDEAAKQQPHNRIEDITVDAVEYDAVRSQAGFAPLEDRGQLWMSGADRATYLQGLLTNDIVALQAGRGCYAAYLTPQGRMIADMRVFELGSRMLIDLPLAVKDTVLQRFDQFIFTEDVQVADASAALRALAIAGPRARDVIADALRGAGPDVSASTLDALEEYASVETKWGGDSVVVVRSGDFGPGGYDLFVPAAAIDKMLNGLSVAGSTRMTAETLDLLRIEAGRPKWGAELRDDVIPLEAGIEERAISFTKGCYVGQEVVIRVLHRGHGRVARKLVGLRLSGGSAAVDAPVVRDGREIGHVTSTARSPRLGAIAMAYVHRDAAEPGTDVMVGSAPARVVPLPF